MYTCRCIERVDKVILYYDKDCIITERVLIKEEYYYKLCLENENKINLMR